MTKNTSSGDVAVNIQSNNNKNETENTDSSSDQQSVQAFDIFKKALTYNVIAKYDPTIDQLIHLSPYCVIYQFDGTDWNKLDYQGPIAFYSRKVSEIKEGAKFSIQDVMERDIYQYGLILLNRAKPENFTIGLLARKYLADSDLDRAIAVEKKEELVILNDFKGDTFGIWLFDEKDREYLYKFLSYCIEN
ncbi:DEBR0S1_32682g1_1 [Brettanomyces bruxellensis]|uniref:DEBR0S1_32682g1_1 n=1 Tax=Dekkera bruxellensis TaxID=5007 RepID=A0A7D9CVX7_DEKBR|nr:uncharacterized protein BRETT_003372 [Brettanomyces bruxellensis]QOU23180.1 hypothetical protein BRETT_003372 [Brettanomyces bruxellensis]VUG17078.1 DEBR0S1_32682g1_1 [Brettanomyces bruxellensis]